MNFLMFGIGVTVALGAIIVLEEIERKRVI